MKASSIRCGVLVFALLGSASMFWLLIPRHGDNERLATSVVFSPIERSTANADHGARWRALSVAADRGDANARQALLNDLMRCWRIPAKEQLLRRVAAIADPTSDLWPVAEKDMLDNGMDPDTTRAAFSEMLPLQQAELRQDKRFCQDVMDVNYQLEHWLYLAALSGDPTALQVYLQGDHIRSLDGTLVDDAQRVADWRARVPAILAQRMLEGDANAIRLAAITQDADAGDLLQAYGPLAAAPDAKLAVRYYALAERTGGCDDRACRDRLTDLFAQMDDASRRAVVTWVDAQCRSAWSALCERQQAAAPPDSR